MTTCIGVLMVSTGFRFEKPRSGNPYGAWPAGDHRGIRGFISTAGKLFKKDYQVGKGHQGRKKNIFQRPKKTIETPNTPFLRADRER